MSWQRALPTSFIQQKKKNPEIKAFSVKFPENPEIKAFSVKFPEFGKIPESLDP